MTVRVVIADDHPMYRFGLRASLDGAEGIEVVAEAEDGEQLLVQVAALQPDVVVTDLAMPKVDGVAAARQIRAGHPTIGILILTMHEDDDALFSALRAGANGYLLKGADRGEIARAVHSVASGDAVYGPAVARRIIDFFTGAQSEYAAAVFPELTSREREVLHLVASGCGNHEIARRLLISEKTVRNHMSALLMKLEVSDRSAAIVKAREAGLGT